MVNPVQTAQQDGTVENHNGHVFWPGDDRDAPDLERERNIALLKTVRAQLVSTIQLCQRYDTSLAYELGTGRAKVEERLANLLLARELARS